MSPRVSIVVVTWNGLALLQRFLPSILATRYPNYEVIVADNASNDGTVEWIAKHYPSVRIIRHPENWLFARGNNEAIAQVDSPLVCLLNNDVEVPPNWLQPLVRLLEHSPRTAAVQPKVLQVNDERVFEYAGASGGFLDRIGYPFARGRMFTTLEKDIGQYDDRRPVSWATGACMLIRRNAFESVGGLDERFEMHMEEIDLCWRLWRHGWSIYVEPESEVYHMGGGSLPQGNPRKTYLNFRNSLLMLYKNTPPDEWPVTSRLRFRMDRLAMTRLLALGKLSQVTAIRKAHRDARAMFESYVGERPSADEPCQMPRYHGLVAMDYFFRRVRSFRDLPAENWTWPSSFQETHSR